MSKLVNDVRPSSTDRRYARNYKPFQGTIAEALAQARAAPDYPPLPITARQELLRFLNIDLIPE